MGSTRYVNLALLSQIGPKNLCQASEDIIWVQAMNEELDKFEKKDTWELVPRPKETNVISIEWVLKKKFNK